MTVGDLLFKEVMSEEEDEDEPYLFNEDTGKRGGKGRKPRAYTLCMIVNPAGYEQAHAQWRQGAGARRDVGKKIVVNSSGYNQATMGQQENN